MSVFFNPHIRHPEYIPHQKACNRQTRFPGEALLEERLREAMGVAIIQISLGVDTIDDARKYSSMAPLAL